MSAPQPLLSALLAAGTLFLTAGGAPAIPPVPQDTTGSEATPEGAPAGLTWPELLQRDARVSFTSRSAFEASLALNDPSSTSALRTAALMAIGCTEPQAVRELPVLEAWALEGSDEERAAALLALGEFGEGGEGPLVDGLGEVDAFLRGCSLLGLARGGRRSSLLRVQLISEGDSADAEMAADALVFALDPTGSDGGPVLERLLELRWNAARQFGLVDGRSWRARLLEDLNRMPRFLDAVVYLSASDLTTPGVKDHLLSALLSSPNEATLRAAVRAMPDELARMMEAGLWSPPGRTGWEILLDEVELMRSEERCLGLLAQALRAPTVSVEAIRLLARAGIPKPVMGLELEWPQLSSEDRCRAAQAWAFTRDAAALSLLEEFAADPDPLVRAHIRLARARLGDEAEHAAFKEALADLEHPDHAVTLEAAIEQAEAPLVRAHLEDQLEELGLEQRVDVLAALALRGVGLARLALAEELRNGFPPGHRGARCVRALLRREPTEFAGLLRDSFPVEDDLVLNVALGLGLVEARDDVALRFLRVALWDDAWDRSVLAALLLSTVGGPGSLRDEVHRIPLDASSRDLRRLGFAIGEWGGLEAIEHLQRRENLLMRSPILQGALMGALGRRTH